MLMGLASWWALVADPSILSDANQTQNWDRLHYLANQAQKFLFVDDFVALPMSSARKPKNAGKMEPALHNVQSH